MMKETILSMIENLQQALRWEEEDCEKTRKCLVERAAKCTAEELAHGWLDADLGDIGRSVEKMKSLRDQITVLELALKKSEK